jgi:hypothetical protein
VLELAGAFPLMRFGRPNCSVAAAACAICAILLYVQGASAGTSVVPNTTKIYYASYADCKKLGLANVARLYHTDRSEVDAAEAYGKARSMLVGLQVVYNEGCLAALYHLKPDYGKGGLGPPAKKKANWNTRLRVALSHVLLAEKHFDGCKLPTVGTVGAGNACATKQAANIGTALHELVRVVDSVSKSKCAAQLKLVDSVARRGLTRIDTFVAGPPSDPTNNLEVRSGVINNVTNMMTEQQAAAKCFNTT